MTTIHVQRGGLLTTVQDTGRRGWQRDGVPEGGAMDAPALRLANLLAGNDEDAAALEVTLAGPTLAFEHGTTIALAGADLGARLVMPDAPDVALPPWRSATVPAGATLVFGPPRQGAIAYVAVAGGLAVEPVLGSRATYLRAALGGLAGRALRTGDVLASAPASRAAGRPRRLAPSAVPAYGDEVRLIAGPHLARLTRESRVRLFRDAFRVSAQSDRMGYRLEGTLLALASPLEPLSAGVAFGTVQLPPGGTPIVLMADRQTTGGYPRLGEVATVDLPTLAQRRPGETVRFREVSLDEAQRLYLAREAEMRRLAWVLRS